MSIFSRMNGTQFFTSVRNLLSWTLLCTRPSGLSSPLSCI